MQGRWVSCYGSLLFWMKRRGFDGPVQFQSRFFRSKPIGVHLPERGAPRMRGDGFLSRIAVDVSEDPSLTYGEAASYTAHSIWRNGFDEALHNGRLSRIKPMRLERDK